eukprot:RCo021351
MAMEQAAWGETDAQFAARLAAQEFAEYPAAAAHPPPPRPRGAPLGAPGAVRGVGGGGAAVPMVNQRITCVGCNTINEIPPMEFSFLCYNCGKHNFRGEVPSLPSAAPQPPAPPRPPPAPIPPSLLPFRGFGRPPPPAPWCRRHGAFHFCMWTSTW